jgi:hypothetical protein
MNFLACDTSFKLNYQNGIDEIGGENYNYTGSNNISIASFDSINVDAFKKYANGGYLNNIKNILKARTINWSNVPQKFLTECAPIAKQYSVPLGFIILVAVSESQFKDVPTNSCGYGGYFGNSTKNGVGYGAPIAKQVQQVCISYNSAKRSSPGAGIKDLLMLGYLYHHLPIVGSKYWMQTNGRIYSLNPDYICENILKCYPACANSPTRLAEAIMVNVCGQYLASQVAMHPEYMK